MGHLNGNIQLQAIFSLSGSPFSKLCQFTPPSICVIMLVPTRRKLRIAQVTIDTTNVLSSVDNDQGSSSNELEVMRPKKTRITMKSFINLIESHHN